MAASPPGRKTAGKRTARKRVSARVVTDGGYQLRFGRVGGIGIAKPDGMVCLRLPPGEGKEKRTSRTWRVTASVPDIEELAGELLAAGAGEGLGGVHVGLLAVVVFRAGGRGRDVQLVNSSQARNLPGRPKTDKADARWIARLTETGLLRPSFVPPPEIRALRQHTRLLARLTQDRVKYWQRLGKLPVDARCKVPR